MEEKEPNFLETLCIWKKLSALSTQRERESEELRERERETERQ